MMVSSRHWLALGIPFVLGLVLLAGFRPGAPSAQAARGSLVGSWLVSINQEDQVLPVALDTFTVDGNAIITTPQPANSVGHGAWVETSPGHYIFTFIVIRKDESGQVVGTTEVRSTADLNDPADAFTGSFQAETYDLTGALVRTSEGSSAATRIVARAPDR